MGYVIPAGFSRVTIEYGAQSSLGSQIVTGFGVNLEPTEGLLDAVEAWIDADLAPRTQTFYSIDRIEARNDVEVVERVLNTPGTLAGDPLPPNTALLVKIGSGLVGRKNRGRMYIPGVLLEDEVDASGGINSSTRTGLQAMMTHLGEAIGLISGEIVILHSDVSDPTIATSVNVDGTVATQRRRLRS